MREDDEEIARIRTSDSRRVVGVGALMALGALMIYLGISTPGMAIAWKAVLTLCGIAALLGGQIMWRATALDLILTKTEVRDSSGVVLARLDQIAKVDRGVFAMKPSNGFVILLKEPAPRAWRPGLWWRMGRRIAVGGVTSGGQTRPFADMITLQLTEQAD